MSAVLALTASALWGTADFFGGHLSRRLPPLVVILVSQAFALAALLGTVALLGLPTAGGWLLWAVVAGVVGPLALGAFYRALSVGTMGVVAPVASTGVLVPVVVGLLAGERPSLLQLSGVAVAIAGVVLASGPDVRAARAAGASRGGHPLLLALLAALGFGLVFAAIAAGSESTVLGTLVVQRLVNVAVTGLALLALRRAVDIDPRQLPSLAAIGLGDVAANAAYAVASTTGLVTVVAVLASLYPVVTALLARQVLQERLRRIQLGGVATAMGGVALLAVG
jgi:drug/metabolite transporter (DMT)-like permease